MWGDGFWAALVPVRLVTGDNRLCWGASYTALRLLTNDAGQLNAKAPGGECFFSAPPLKITGGVGSPLNPLAIQ